MVLSFWLTYWVYIMFFDIIKFVLYTPLVALVALITFIFE